MQINSPMSWKLSTGSVSCLDSGCNGRRVFSSCLIRRWTSPTTPEFQCFATAIRLDTKGIKWEQEIWWVPIGLYAYGTSESASRQQLPSLRVWPSRFCC
uniref:Uncharacterized protein n=1 Tax=Hyaloperonospora arabidopsidis (strain Emoy2) TaxID=559515 RepID=M4BGM3_HYAAE